MKSDSSKSKDLADKRINGYNPLYDMHLRARGMQSFRDLADDIPSSSGLPPNLESMKKELYSARNDIDATCKNARVFRMTLRSSRKEEKLERLALP